MGLIKNRSEIELMRESCSIVAQVLKHITGFIEPGVTTEKLDKVIEDFIISKGGIPAFKGYGGSRKVKPYPASACISVNEEVVHGIPGEKVLIEGDIVSIDVGVKKNGYFGDSAKTYKVGKVSQKKETLMKVTEESLFLGIGQAVDGNELNDIASAIQSHCEGHGFGVVRALVGHGIGKNLHEEPAVPNYFVPNNRFRLRQGMVIAIEPMINYGTYEVKTLKDGWTIVTADGEPSAHFEHTILITDTKPEILTL
jgi:methionyl aminopeptidase